MAGVEISPEVKKQRMKIEVQFARDSSTNLPKVDQFFKIQVVLPNMKSRDKSNEDFGEALVIFLGKKANRAVMEYLAFKHHLTKLTV